MPEWTWSALELLGLWPICQCLRPFLPVASSFKDDANELAIFWIGNERAAVCFLVRGLKRRAIKRNTFFARELLCTYVGHVYI